MLCNTRHNLHLFQGALGIGFQTAHRRLCGRQSGGFKQLAVGLRGIEKVIFARTYHYLSTDSFRQNVPPRKGATLNPLHYAVGLNLQRRNSLPRINSQFLNNYASCAKIPAVFVVNLGIFVDVN